MNNDKWISVKDKLPSSDEVCYTTNSKYAGEHIAIYHNYYAVFVLYNPELHSTICLDVTHWMALPSPIIGEE